ncbi:hypothetical protein KUCAC02_011162 [Chaenocephalus aceratus]|uniref:Uncharacterized protein n=1 Tax=Chaenocephalus aceratus TaxID=36190 RepID=A0ACB9WV34_CHAAC|nr:hypothetical protein KUCAC02_011162 [Chaenocephalus aceratus]
MSDSLRLQLPTATYITLTEPRSGSGSSGKKTQGNKSSALKMCNTHRKQTGPLTSSGVPSPPPSYGVSSPCSRGVTTAAPPPQGR